MNILYITYLYGRKWTGPNYSVPSQIKAQSNYDNVFFYNLNNLYKNEGDNSIKCHNIEQYPKRKIKFLPKPFDNPDIVVFQGVYFYEYFKLARECIKRNIPYIIIPRSSLTELAQKSKILKKRIANILIFNYFVKNALAIQYLTDQEFKDSGIKWNSNHLIIPNGIDPCINNKNEKTNTSNQITGVYIGRLDIYQKGIDLLLEACSELKEELIQNNIQIRIYGPDRENRRAKILEIINNYELNKLVLLQDGVYEKEKEEVLSKSDFFILTSRFEGHPMGLIEALSYGLPCFVTEGTNMGKEIKENDAGWVAENNKDSILRALMKLIEKKDEIYLKVNNALELSKKYNWDNIAKLSHEKYRELIKKMG